MKKYKKLIPIIFVILFACCSNVSDMMFERLPDANRGIEEITEEEQSIIEDRDIYDIIPPVFSINKDSSSPFFVSRFLSGRIEYSLIHIDRVPFWNMPLLIKPFFSSLLTKQKEETIIIDSSIYEVSTCYINESESTYTGIVKLETNNALLSYSLNGEPFEAYIEPIEITEPTVITVKAEEKNTSKFLLSSTFSYNAEKNP